MTGAFQSTREVIIRTTAWRDAVTFYESVLGLPVTMRTPTMVGFETGAFCLYVEDGEQHGPVFEFLVADVQATKRTLLDAGCKVVEEDPSLPKCYVRDPNGLVFNLGPAKGDAR